MVTEGGRHSPETEGATVAVHAARCLQCPVETLIPQERTRPRNVEEAAEIPVSQTQGRVVEVIPQEKMQEQTNVTVKAILRAMPGPRIQEHINEAVKVSSSQQCIVEGIVRVPRVQEQIVEVMKMIDSSGAGLRTHRGRDGRHSTARTCGDDSVGTSKANSGAHLEEIGDVCVPQLIGGSTDVVKPMLRTWCRAAQWSKSCD